MRMSGDGGPSQVWIFRNGTIRDGSARMKPATTKDEILDEILLGPADEFEAGNPHGRTFEPWCPEEFEPLRKCLADMIAEGWLRRPLKIYSLTPSGYRNFKFRIKVLRALGK
jgi:hypothetical protein